MRSFLVASLMGLTIVASALAAPPDWAGDWAGTLDAGVKLRLVIHLANTGGTWSGTMDSVDQGANGIPFSAVTVDGAKLHVEIASIGGSYDGVMSDDGATIAGTWKQGGNVLPLGFKRGDASSMPGPKRPQEPKPPLPYHVEDVTYPGPGGITLAGTLTLPEGTGPYPVVLLISGSGPQDRDETVFSHRPFLVLGDYLTRNGLAVLRVDDRGVGQSTGSFKNATTEDFAQDALAGVTFLKSRKDIDGTSIGLVGHSEGGIVAPIVATRSKDVAFIVLMAGVGVPAEELTVRQASDMMKAAGMPASVIELNEATLRRMCDIAKAESDSTERQKQLVAAADVLATKLTALDPSQAEMTKQATMQSVEMVGSPWFRYLLTLDPAETLRKVKVPVLAINGTVDLQVAADANLPAINKALTDGGNKDVTTTPMPNLNHLFQTAATGAPSEYFAIEETMSPDAMQAISSWILARTKKK